MTHWLHPLARPTRAAIPSQRTILRVVNLEDRFVPSSPTLDNPFGHVDRTAAEAVYVESNNPAPAQNAVLGFRRNPANGSLTQFGSFPTGGTGQLNVPKVVGPDDGDQQVRVTADGRFLYAVNQGSDTVTAFRIRDNGDLDWIGSFATGGVQPDSIGIAGEFLYVADRGDATATHPGTVAPQITGFTIEPDGSLTAIPNSTVTFPVGTFVTQTLITRDNRFLFANVASLSGAAEGNTLSPFQIGVDGTLHLAPGGNVAAGSNTSLILGAAAHPTLNIVYSGLTAAGQVGVFTYDETGRTSFVGASVDQGRAPCWCVVSGDGRVLYAANTATDSIGVYSLADPLHPVQIQEFALGGPHSASGTGFQTAVFEIALDPTGRSLYAVGQSTDPNFQPGNQLHTLSVARDGTLSEPHGPVILNPVDALATAHPQGVVAVGLHVRDDIAPPRGDDDGSDAEGRHGW
jgi:6-phosphogluconolactonase (cycloisomerase 2 family)